MTLLSTRGWTETRGVSRGIFPLRACCPRQVTLKLLGQGILKWLKTSFLLFQYVLVPRTTASPTAGWGAERRYTRLPPAVRTARQIWEGLEPQRKGIWVPRLFLLQPRGSQALIVPTPSGHHHQLLWPEPRVPADSASLESALSTTGPRTPAKRPLCFPFRREFRL